MCFEGVVNFHYITDSSFFPCRIHGDDDWRIGKTAIFLRHFSLSLQDSGDNIKKTCFQDSNFIFRHFRNICYSA